MCVKLVENPQLPQDARSTEYKIKERLRQTHSLLRNSNPGHPEYANTTTNQRSLK
jgi:hypothetical protein